ncbi:MAG TPA: GNAT family N-acetyltransferase [Gammaproteobacteria bacterium]
MPIRVIHDLSKIAASEWNALEGGIDNPFLRHEFLAALEQHGCVGDQWGWRPRHIVLRDESNKLIGAVPLYLKNNSYGELVFDWSWADAYQRQGLRYYPKLVSAIPYSPVTGARLLVHPDAERAAAEAHLIAAARELLAEEHASSLHWLFPDDAQMTTLEQHGFLRRTGCQFHWFNRGYESFDHYLDHFTRDRRKKVKQERRKVRDAKVTLEALHGDEVSDEQWAIFHRFYTTTFDKRGGHATLTLDFFKAIARALPRNIVLVLALHEGRYVAGALNLRSSDTLYGRHWGCLEEFDSLHFEACYYAGIDYCIAHGLHKFEPGAQGEHKVWRGFEPTPTWSAHHLDHPGFSEAVARYLQQEQESMAEYMQELRSHLPFKQEGEA